MDSDSLFMDMRLPIPTPTAGKGIMISTHNAVRLPDVYVSRVSRKSCACVGSAPGESDGALRRSRRRPTRILLWSRRTLSTRGTSRSQRWNGRHDCYGTHGTAAPARGS
eukprot:7387226-Prymnesium_polylepis.2